MHALVPLRGEVLSGRTARDACFARQCPERDAFLLRLHVGERLVELRIDDSGFGEGPELLAFATPPLQKGDQALGLAQRLREFSSLLRVGSVEVPNMLHSSSFVIVDRSLCNAQDRHHLFHRMRQAVISQAIAQLQHVAFARIQFRQE